MRIRIIFGFQIFVLSILSEESELESLTSNEAGINKRHPSYMNALINRYNEATPNKYSSSGLIFHWDCTKYKCSEYPHGIFKCVSFKYIGSKYKHRLLECKKRAPDSKVADPNKWKPHPDCLPVFYYDEWYIKGCKVDEIPFCRTRQDNYLDWKYCIDIKKVDGGWSVWSPWSECRNTCGNRSRVRECNNPSPRNGGKDCPQMNRETDKCSQTECPIVGKWSLWSPWNTCSHTCGSGVKQRIRSCLIPTEGRNACDGDSKEAVTCLLRECSRKTFASFTTSNIRLIIIYASLGLVGLASLLALAFFAYNKNLLEKIKGKFGKNGKLSSAPEESNEAKISNFPSLYAEE